MALLSDPAYYLTHFDGETLETSIVVPEEDERRPAFFLFSSVGALQEYARLSGMELRRFNLMSFERLEDIERFVQRYSDFYEYVVINPRLGLRSPIEPFEQLIDMARALVVSGDVQRLREPAFYLRHGTVGYPLRTRLPEGVTMPVFSGFELALQWMGAYDVEEGTYHVAGFYTLNEVRTFADEYEPVFQYITINPAPDPEVPPTLQPFRKLLEIAESVVQPTLGQTEAPVAPDTQYEPEVGPTAPPPAAIQESIRDFQKDHSDPNKTAFIMMEFGNGWEHAAIAEVIKDVLKDHNIVGLRADDKRYNDHLYPNVQTYMHGCGIGVAVYDRIKADTHNPNVALEVGYMLALKKPVCLLKDETLPALHADLVGLLHDNFDTRNPDETIPTPLSKWLSDKGLG